MFKTFVLKLTNFYNRLFKKAESIKEPLEEIRRADSGQKKGRYDFSTMDRTPLSRNTIELIEYFKKGIKNSETPKIGGNFKNEGRLLKKLSRYETFINFLIEHISDDKLPSEKFIVENCKYENAFIFTSKIIRSHKEAALVIGDLTKDDNGRYTLVRKEKY